MYYFKHKSEADYKEDYEWFMKFDLKKIINAPNDTEKNNIIMTLKVKYYQNPFVYSKIIEITTPSP